uniref:EPIDERMAL PATTERNING FACTOR-like protein 6 n=1 Tax=Cicer arietinum TaxID=3827 RepID=A0A3Q7XQL9_CICAR|nr:EPIDERMAL PATTERNING FACTOR-like protein 6 [Cicer arietinum]
MRKAIMFVNKIQLYCVVFFFLLTIFTTVFSITTASPSVNIHQKVKEKTGEDMVSIVSSRRLFEKLIGSSPPNCKNKCPQCPTTCDATLVYGPYGSRIWSCKCANNLSIP